MAEIDPQQAARLKTITNALEASYQNMRVAASNISGLIGNGRATCAMVKAYNIGALMLYNAQTGMLGSLRNAGQPNLPQLPPQPTLFKWKGVTGANALSFDCSTVDARQGLSGVLAAAMRDPAPVYLPAGQIEISTQDIHALNPEASPSYQQLLQAQAAATGGGLGNPFLIIIAAVIITIGVAAIVNAIMEHLNQSSLNEANTAQVQAQTEAYANYTKAVMGCFGDCISRGGSSQSCADTCSKLVKPPNIRPPGQAGAGWGALQWVGFLTVSTFGVWVAYRLYKRKQETGHILPQVDFSLPEGA